jgi:phospholipid/cholesterol/gamma-HCH transport system substrate-binding protein
MHNTKTQDTLVGLFVACGIAALFFMAMKISNFGSFNQDNTYTVIAHFDNNGGIKVKAPVSIAGVRVGRVSNIYIDNNSYEAVVEISIEPQFKIPDDTSASIFTAGLLGEKYIHLDPGGSEDFIENNGIIDLTQPAIVLEEVIGQFLISTAENK